MLFIVLVFLNDSFYYNVYLIDILIKGIYGTSNVSLLYTETHEWTNLDVVL